MLNKNKRGRIKNNKKIDIIPVIMNKKPWYQSTTIQRAIVGLVNTLAAAIGLSMSGAEAQALVAGVIGIVTTIGVILGRKNANTRLTKILILTSFSTLLVFPSCSSLNTDDLSSVSPYVGQANVIGAEVKVGGQAFGVALTHRTLPRSQQETEILSDK